MKNAREQGFTLIEAAVAIAVVAILSGIVVPLVVKNLDDSRRARAANDIQVIAAAIASQLKDTANRPSVGGGPGGASGAGNLFWASGPAGATSYPVGVAAGNANNLFTNLFSTAASPANAQVMFALPNLGAAANAGQEFAYKGPYLGSDVAAKTDPWGTRYLIIGYNQNGQNTNGAIWVVCAGPNKTISAVNSLTNPPVNGWTKTTTSVDDIVVRVN
ncbi:MAG: prepilin-type N-terminal cleavage/methylation domain-containing protein [Acidobacteria bacterium]|nr:prepilin-type N-terminal cleavage/methylation domain-containing protein [Acidobacteriota bacterium]